MIRTPQHPRKKKLLRTLGRPDDPGAVRTNFPFLAVSVNLIGGDIPSVIYISACKGGGIYPLKVPWRPEKSQFFFGRPWNFGMMFLGCWAFQNTFFCQKKTPRQARDMTPASGSTRPKFEIFLAGQNSHVGENFQKNYFIKQLLMGLGCKKKSSFRKFSTYIEAYSTLLGWVWPTFSLSFGLFNPLFSKLLFCTDMCHFHACHSIWPNPKCTEGEE